MASVTITFTDSPHGVAIASSFTPAAGLPLTTAQAAALDVYVRACRQWGGVQPAQAATPAIDPARPGCGQAACTCK